MLKWWIDFCPKLLTSVNPKISQRLELCLDAESSLQLDKICSEMEKHEQETVKLNFQIGDLLNQTVDDSGLNAAEVCSIFESKSGISSGRIQTNARIARRTPLADRPKNVPWGVIKYLMADISPLSLKTSESEACDASLKALKKVASSNLKLKDLNTMNGEYSVGEIMVRGFLKA
jgi:hypothetical protein